MTETEKPAPSPEAELLQAALVNSGETKREVAAAVGASYQHINRMFAGAKNIGAGQWRSVQCSTDLLARLAVHLHITTEELHAVGRPDAAQRMPAILDQHPDPLARYSRAELQAEIGRRKAVIADVRRWFDATYAPQLAGDHTDREIETAGTVVAEVLAEDFPAATLRRVIGPASSVGE